MTTALVNISQSLLDQLQRMVDYSFEKALETVLNRVCTKYAESEASITGLREQIKGSFTRHHFTELH